MDAIADAVLAAAASPWIYALVLLLVVADAFLVVVPSETVVVALAALSTGGVPALWLVVLVAAIGAVIGDTLVFGLGRSVGSTRFGWMRHPRAIRSFAWARRGLDRRAAVVLMTARFIPFARIAVNITAGATRYPYPRFLLLTSIAGCIWALYNVGIGAFFGAVFDGSPVLAVIVSIVVAVAVGLAIDRVASVIRRRVKAGDAAE